MSKSPGALITVIIVTYNAAHLLEKSILSVINNNYKNIELIIIDGNSIDGTLSIINRYSSQLKYWVSEPDEGIYDAMNKGWDVADLNSYILYLGAGDKLIELPELDEITDTIILGNVLIDNKYTFESKVNFKLMLGNTLHHQALLVPKIIHPKPPFSLKYKIYSDFDFNQRLYKSKSKFKKDARFLSYASPGGVSEIFDPSEPLKIVRKNYGLFVFLLARIYYYLQLKFK